jgi:DNA-binding MarR family transcriptional regulator
MGRRVVDLSLIGHVWFLNDTSLRRVEAKLEERVGCSLAEFKLMHMTRSYDENLTPTHVARRLGCSNANVTKTMKRLGRVSWVAKLPNPLDARTHVLRLTSAGEAAYEQCVADIAEMAGDLFEGLEEDEQDLLHALLARLHAKIRAGER